MNKIFLYDLIEHKSLHMKRTKKEQEYLFACNNVENEIRVTGDFTF